MGIATERDGHGDVTLALALSAAERCAEPAAVVADARRWSRYVGVVANDPAAVEDFVAEHDLTQDFALDDDIWLAMEAIREATDTPRHVFVGTDAEHRRIADHLGWEFVHLHEAAEKAGWTLADREASASTSPGFLDRLRSWIRSRFE